MTPSDPAPETFHARHLADVPLSTKGDGHLAPLLPVHYDLPFHATIPGGFDTHLGMVYT